MIEYLHLHEHSIFQPGLEPALAHAEASEIFHSEAVESNQRKRRTSSNSEAESAAKRQKSVVGGLGLLSPPLFQNGGAGGFGAARKEMFAAKWGAYPGKQI